MGMRAFHTLRLLSLTVLCLLGLGYTSISQSQSADASKTKVNADDLRIARLLEQHISTIISRHIPESEFNVVVTLGQNTQRKLPEVSKKEEKKLSLPYMPDRELSNAGIRENTPPEELVQHASKVKITIMITDGYDAKTKTRIKSLIVQKLGLNEGRGDSIAFEDLRIKVEKPDAALTKSLNDKDRELRDLQKNLKESERLAREADKKHEKELTGLRQTISKLEAEVREAKRAQQEAIKDNESRLSEISDLRADLRAKESLLSSDKQAASNELQRIRQDLQKSESGARTTQATLEQLEKERSDLRQDLASLEDKLQKLRQDNQSKDSELKDLRKLKNKPEEEPLFRKHMGQGMVALGLLTIGLFLAGALIIGLRLIAQRTEKSVSSIGRAIEKVAAQQTHSNATLDIHPDPNTSPSPAGADKAVVNEAVHIRIARVREEILASLNPHAEISLLRHLNHLLSKPETVYAAVLALELLGKDKANTMFHKLNAEDRAKILHFIEAGIHKQSKPQAMLEVGEDLQTRLLADTLVTGSTLNRELEALLVRLTEKALLSLVLKMDESLTARFLCYFSSSELAHMLNRAKAHSPEVMRKIQQKILEIPKAQDRMDLDPRLLDLIQTVLGQQDQDNDSKYVEFYKNIVDQLEDDVSQQLVLQLAKGSEEMKAHFEEHLITLSLLPSLLKEYRDEIYVFLTTQDLAVVLLSLTQGKALFTELSPSVQEMVREEVALLRNFQPAKLRDMTKQVEKKFAQKIKVLKGNRPLKDILTPDTASAQGRKSA